MTSSSLVAPRPLQHRLSDLAKASRATRVKQSWLKQTEMTMPARCSEYIHGSCAAAKMEDNILCAYTALLYYSYPDLLGKRDRHFTTPVD